MNGRPLFFPYTHDTLVLLDDILDTLEKEPRACLSLLPIGLPTRRP